jgi:hypothetical protein
MKAVENAQPFDKLLRANGIVKKRQGHYTRSYLLLALLP